MSAPLWLLVILVGLAPAFGYGAGRLGEFIANSLLRLMRTARNRR